MWSMSIPCRSRRPGSEFCDFCVWFVTVPLASIEYLSVSLSVTSSALLSHLGLREKDAFFCGYVVFDIIMNNKYKEIVKFIPS